MSNSTVMICRPAGKPGIQPTGPGQFREKFKRSLRQCVVHGFSVEESFGMIWMETLEDIPLTEPEQGKAYEELISWAKTTLLDFLPTHSQELLTATEAGFSGYPE